MTEPRKSLPAVRASLPAVAPRAGAESDVPGLRLRATVHGALRDRLLDIPSSRDRSAELVFYAELGYRILNGVVTADEEAPLSVTPMLSEDERLKQAVNRGRDWLKRIGTGG